MRKDTKILLDAVVTVGASDPVEVENYDAFTFFIEATGVTTGGTMDIESLAPSGNWVVVSSTVVESTGDTVVHLSGAHQQLQANLSARTDGAYTVSANFRGGR